MPISIPSAFKTFKITFLESTVTLFFAYTSKLLFSKSLNPGVYSLPSTINLNCLASPAI